MSAKTFTSGGQNAITTSSMAEIHLMVQNLACFFFTLTHLMLACLSGEAKGWFGQAVKTNSQYLLRESSARQVGPIPSYTKVWFMPVVIFKNMILKAK